MHRSAEASVIDAHTHAFPPEIVKYRERYVGSERWFNELYKNPSAKLTGTDELLASMERTGVRRSIIAGFPWADPGLCREHNAWMAEECRRRPERLSFLAIVQPGDEHASRDASVAFESGAAGIGELNADAQGFAIEHPSSTGELVEVCREYGKPIMFHTSEPTGHDYPGKGSATPDKLVKWLEAFPGQPVVFAHWGGGLPFYELMPEVRGLTENVWYDTAATTYLYDFSVFPTVLSIVGRERVLFGSDFPVLGQRRLLPRVLAAIDEGSADAVMEANARRVYGVP